MTAPDHEHDSASEREWLEGLRPEDQESAAPDHEQVERLRINVPNLTPKTARRLADIAEALEPIGVTEISDASYWNLDPPDRCPGCDCVLEAGHCYCCFPVFGYGERFQVQRHGEGFRPDAKALDS